MARRRVARIARNKLAGVRYCSADGGRRMRLQDSDKIGDLAPVQLNVATMTKYKESVVVRNQ